MASESNRPNFFIVGAPKTGTTALCQYLGDREDVFLSNPKEPFYWCSDFPKSKKLHGMVNLDAYLKLFDNADPDRHTAIGEGSTTYMQSRVAIGELMRFNPDAKVIAMLRNPVEMVHAMHGELVRHFLEDERDFERAWRLQENRRRGLSLPAQDRMDHQLQYADVASLASQVERLFEHVPVGQRKIVVFDDFVADTAAVYREILSFLKLPDDGRTDFPKVHAAKVFRNEFVGKLYHSPPGFLEPLVSRFRKWFMGSRGPIRLVLSKMASKEKKRASLNPDFRSELIEYFREDVDKLSGILDRDLSRWLK